MDVTDGPRPKKVRMKTRHHIETLQSRLDFLRARMEQRSEDDAPWHRSRAEIAALEWAIPVLEADWLAHHPASFEEG